MWNCWHMQYIIQWSLPGGHFKWTLMHAITGIMRPTDWITSRRRVRQTYYILLAHQQYQYLFLFCSPSSVQCYRTCIEGTLINPVIPFRCCADRILDPPMISQTFDPNYVLLRIYAPNMPDQEAYEHNSLCRYTTVARDVINAWRMRTRVSNHVEINYDICQHFVHDRNAN